MLLFSNAKAKLYVGSQEEGSVETENRLWEQLRLGTHQLNLVKPEDRFLPVWYEVLQIKQKKFPHSPFAISGCEETPTKNLRTQPFLMEVWNRGGGQWLAWKGRESTAFGLTIQSLGYMRQ
jgi:hypothetical protein